MPFSNMPQTSGFGLMIYRTEMENCNGTTAVLAQENHVPRITVQNVLVRINFGKLVLIATLLPFCGMLVCLLSCLIFQFDQVNITFCAVKNYLPSISAVTAVRPQIHIWRLCIALHCTPRFLIALLYRATYNQNLEKCCNSGADMMRCRTAVKVDFIFSLVENITLLLTSIVSSHDHYWTHEKFFCTFLFTSVAHMMLCCYLYPRLFYQPFLLEELRAKSLQVKRRILTVVLLLAVGMAFAFVRHRRYCAPGAWSIFSFCEYWVAVLNMGFHLTCAWDFVGKELIIAGWPENKILNGDVHRDSDDVGLNRLPSQRRSS